MRSNGRAERVVPAGGERLREPTSRRRVAAGVAGRVRHLRDWLRGSGGGVAALALATGAGAGAGAIVFRYLIVGFTIVFSGRSDHSALGRAGNSLLGVGPWFVLLAPVVGGLLYGPLIHLFAREARGHGVPEVMLAVADRGGRIRPRVPVVKSLASALCIGSGGSVGREGPIVQIGSALGSALGQLVRVPESRLRVLVACGAAGGISATFNAPIAGVFFALELILRDFEADSFGVVVLSSFVADVVGRAAFGSQPFLHLPAFRIASPVDYPLYALLGVGAAFAGVAFIRVLYGTEDVADRLWRGPEWLRPAVGGGLLGLLLLALPELYGVGYPPLENGIRGHYGVALLLILLVGKIAATSLTIAIGGSGGVFAPSLFMGAMLGSAYGIGFHHLLPGITGPAGAYGLVGMGAVFAAAARAPITAVIIIFELTGDYRIILPLMFAIAVAVAVSKLLSPDTVYTLKLRRRGIDVMRGRGANFMQLLTVRDAMREPPEPVPAGMPLNDVAARVAELGATDGVPVANDDGSFAGMLSPRRLEEAMRENALDACAGELAEPLPALRGDDSLEAAVAALLRAQTALPVVDADGRVVGSMSHVDVLRAYNRRLEQALERGAPDRSRPRTLSRVRARLQGYRIRELEVAAKGPAVGRRIAEIPWPPHTSVLALRRSGRAFEPRNDERLRQGDVLTVLAPEPVADDLADALTGAAGAPADHA